MIPSDLQPWREHANCLGNPEPFFADAQIGTDSYAEAREVCGACPVTAQCLAWALANGELDHGMWGGMSPKERRRHARKLRTLKPCGTHTAYVRHLARGEKPCARCVAAQAEYDRARYLIKRGRKVAS